MPLFLRSYNDWKSITVSFVAFLSAGTGSFCPKQQADKVINTNVTFNTFIWNDIS
jgi:hypothetical protein